MSLLKRAPQTEKDKLYATTQKFAKGTHYTGGRSHYRSLMDGNRLDKQLDDYDSLYGGDGKGGRGVYNLKVLQADGSTAAAGATINIGGRLFKANDTGDLRILDGGYLDEELAASKAQREYEEQVLEKCLVSNDLALIILGKTGFGYLSGGAGPNELSADLKAVEAKPDSIRYMNPTSKEYTSAIAKLRSVIHLLGDVIINNEK